MKIFTRDFPPPSIHEGAMLGNSWLGLYVWGEGRKLNLTVGCSNLWDHRGGLEWTPRQNYADIRKALETRDQAMMDALFETPNARIAGQADRPSLIPAGRIEITLAEGAELLTTEADYAQGVVRVFYCIHGQTAHAHGQTAFAEIRLDMKDKGAFACKCDDIAHYAVQSSYDLSGSALSAISFEAPVRLDDGDFRGFLQYMPADEPFALGAIRCSNILACRFSRERKDDQNIQNHVKSRVSVDWDRLATENASWWKSFWQVVPEVSLDNKALEDIYYESLAKFGMMTAPDGVPAGLQGPWIEDNALPPWSADYHFNINVEMCYWPAYRANLLENLRPLFDMLLSWKDVMRENARLYIGIDNGYMMPHAVDDRCVCMGHFWPGTIDCGCGAWMCQMMFDYYSYTGDLAFLRDSAFDLMKGVFNVFHAMLEWQDGKLRLPLTVSPEYGGNSLDAWGANASFQLAALHRLTQDLQSAARILGEKPDERWQLVASYLPKASLTPCGKNSQEIALWDGMPLPESHRHHSHLGGICPFDVIDPDAPEWKEIVANSRRRWTLLGMGQWTGWCMPWAAMLYNRLDNGNMAELILDIWRKVFRNPGGGSLHDADFKGFSIYDSRRHVMQIDATMGALTAIQDMLLHSRQGVLHVFAGIPEAWRKVSFKDMPAPGGFVVSATRVKRGDFKVTATATRAGDIRLAVHDSRELKALAGTVPVSAVNGIFSCHLEPGQTLQVYA